jgi:hypothetical protein
MACQHASASGRMGAGRARRLPTTLGSMVAIGRCVRPLGMWTTGSATRFIARLSVWSMRYSTRARTRTSESARESESESESESEQESEKISKTIQISDIYLISTQVMQCIAGYTVLRYGRNGC